MEQIYSSVVNMLQFSSETKMKTETNRVSEETAPSEFEKLMNKTAEQQGSAAENPRKPVESKDTEAETAGPYTENADEEQTIDIELMQELAASQMMVYESGTVHIVRAEAPEAELSDTVVQKTQADIKIASTPVTVNEAEANTGDVGIAVEDTVQLQPQQVSEDSGFEQTAPDMKNTGDNAKEIELTVKSRDDDSSEIKDSGEQVFKNVESAPIKVAEPVAKNQEAQPAAEAENVEIQVGTKLSEAVQNGETKVEIRLEPENLGVVNVEITRSADGAIGVVLSAESKETQSLLKECSRGLETLLSNNGRQPVEITVPRQEVSQNSENRYGDLPDGRGEGQNGRQQERRQNQTSTEDFLHQLRLGLIPLDEAS